MDAAGATVLRTEKTAGVPPRGFEPLISTLKGWRPRPLDDGGGQSSLPRALMMQPVTLSAREAAFSGQVMHGVTGNASERPLPTDLRIAGRRLSHRATRAGPCRLEPWGFSLMETPSRCQGQCGPVGLPQPCSFRRQRRKLPPKASRSFVLGAQDPAGPARRVFHGESRAPRPAAAAGASGGGGEDAQDDCAGESPGGGEDAQPAYKRGQDAQTAAAGL